MRNFVLIFCVFAIPNFAWSADRCFEQKFGRTSAVQAYRHVDIAPSIKYVFVERTCTELDPVSRKNYSRESLVGTAISLVGIIPFITSMGAGALSRWDRTDDQREFMAQLQRIRKIRNRMERIRLVHQLVSRQQGPYDHEHGGGLTDLRGLVFFGGTPDVIFTSIEKDGKAGVCRHHAMLLYWSLRVVERAEGSTRDDFDAGVMTSVDRRHAWVRVRLPNEKGHDYVDLDTTQFPGEPVFLYPRKSGLKPAQQRAYYESCKRTASCLKVEAQRHNERETLGRMILGQPSSSPRPKRTSN